MFFDRDGVLNKAVVRNGRPYPPRLSEMVVEDGVLEALERLSRCLPLMIVVTNQPDVARKTVARSDVENANAYLAKILPPLTAFYTCYHDDRDACACRKPRPGLFLKAAEDFGIDLRASYMIGDRWRDVDAGSAAGTTTILVDRDYREIGGRAVPDVIVTSPIQAIDAIIASEGARKLPNKRRRPTWFH